MTTEERNNNMLESTQIISLCAEMIQIEFGIDLVNFRFINPALNNHSRRIKESSEAIHTHLSSLVNNKDREFFSYSYSVQMHRLFSFTSGLTVDQLRDFNDGIDRMVKEANKEEVKL